MLSIKHLSILLRTKLSWKWHNGIFLSLFLCSCFVSIAQNDNNNLSKYQLLQYADMAKNMNDYKKQSAYLKSYLKLNKDNNEVRFDYSYALLKDRNYTEALANLKKCIEKDDKLLYKSLFYAGICLKNTGNYDDAQSYFNKCLKNTKDKKLRYKSKLALLGCLIGHDTLKYYQPVVKHNLGNKVNSKHIDMSPIVLDNKTLLYVNMDGDSVISYSLNEHKPPIRVFKVAKFTDKGWQKTNETLFNEEFTKNVSGGAFSVDKKRFYFTLSEYNWKNKNIDKIWMVENINGQWKNAIELPPNVNSNDYTSTHVTVSDSYNSYLEIIYFASDRAGGIGGMDIWFTIYNKSSKTFNSPKNCGSKINTKYDEVTPYYCNELKTLYYSSNQLSGYGSFDVYESVGSLRRWTPPLHLPYPMNTNADEIYYTFLPESNSGFMVSNMPGSLSFSYDYCCYDIYSFKYIKTPLPKIKGKVLVSIDSIFSKYLARGLKLRSNDSLAVLSDYYRESNAKLYIVDTLSAEELLVEERQLSDTGTYNFTIKRNNRYRIDILNKEDKIGEFKINAISSFDSVFIEMDEVSVDIKPEEPIEISNINYAFNETELSAKAKSILDTTLVALMSELPEINIEVHSHTDSVGSNEFNLNLSKKRALHVVDYLTSKGITRQRLKAKGLGEMHPIAPNTNPDGSDNTIGRRLNRRTEFIIFNN